MPVFNLERFIQDVFSPEPDETVTLMTDIPHGEYIDHDAWIERRQMAEEWHKGFVRLAEKIGFTIRPFVQYAATGAHAAPFPREGIMADQPIGLEETLLDSTLVVAFGQFSATAPLLLLTKRKAAPDGGNGALC